MSPAKVDNLKMLNIANISALLNKTIPYSGFQTSTVDAPHPCNNTQNCIPQANSANQKALRSEALRRATFQGWPLPHPTSIALASAGFFYRGVADQTQCAFCYITISQWEPQDSPMEEHKRHAPNCPFVLGLPVGNVPITAPPSDRSNVPSTSSLNHTPILSSIPIPTLQNGGVDSCSRFLNEARPNAAPERGTCVIAHCYNMIIARYCCFQLKVQLPGTQTCPKFHQMPICHP